MTLPRFLLLALLILCCIPAAGRQPAIGGDSHSHALRVVDPLPMASPEARKERIADILSRSEFRAAKTGAIEKFIESIRDWIEKQIERIVRLFDSDFSFGDTKTLSTIIALVSIVFLVFLLIYIVLKIRRKRRFTSNATEAVEDLGGSQEMLDGAARMAAAGDYRTAIRLVYMATLYRLDESGLIRFDRTRTNWEYLTSLRKHSDLYQTMRPITMSFDRKWYGHESSNRDDYANFLSAYQAVESCEVTS